MNPYRMPSPPPREIVFVQRSSSVRLAVVVGVLCFIAGAMMNCLPREAKEALADKTYAAEHLRCVDAYDTRAEIDACRRDVRRRWGIAETITDGGRDADR